MIPLLSQLSTEFWSIGPLDGLTIGTLALLEGILSVDNALVLAILVRHLPEKERRKGLTYGLVGAFVFRIIAIVFASSLIQFIIFKFVGGAYLLYLAMKNMFRIGAQSGREDKKVHQAGFWKTIFLVEMTDIVFSIDSITTAVAMSNKLLIIYFGGVLGIVFMRFLSSFFVTLLEKFPKLEDLAYQLVFFIGTRLTLEALHIEMEHTIFWLMMGVIAIIGASLVYKDWKETTLATVFHDGIVEKLKKHELSLESILTERKSLPVDTVRHLITEGYLRVTSKAALQEMGVEK
ncbi:TerC family protein [Candidatus Peregrinibacteria bacterium]|nr:TerC family protein [Candidatus Peregrinibacteria bacterium]